MDVHAAGDAEALAGVARSRLGSPSTPAGVDSVAPGNRTNRPPIRKFKNQREEIDFCLTRRKE